MGFVLHGLSAGLRNFALQWTGMAKADAVFKLGRDSRIDLRYAVAE